MDINGKTIIKVVNLNEQNQNQKVIIKPEELFPGPIGEILPTDFEFDLHHSDGILCFTIKGHGCLIESAVPCSSIHEIAINGLSRQVGNIVEWSVQMNYAMGQLSTPTISNCIRIS